MSEEILRALMQLFALITKQDGGIGQKEINYVDNFLVQQIGVESSREYLQLYKETARADFIPEKKLTSVLDSVRVLKLCKQISSTINQRQKVVVLVRILELINAEYHLTEQRLGIVRTVADIFRISPQEYEDILTFVTSVKVDAFTHKNHLVVCDYMSTSSRQYHMDGVDTPVFFLRVPSVELYFLKYTGQKEVFLNGLNVRTGVIYLFASGSSLRLPVGQPIHYSDIASHFMSGLSVEKITLEADSLSYRFPGGVTGLHNVTFSARQGNLVGIMGSSGSGKTTLLNVLSGMYRPASGHIRINGLDLVKDGEQLKGVSGYVPQDDLLIEELTVFENLYYSAKFCFGNLTGKEIRKKVTDTLASLGLKEKHNLKVGSVMNKTISGGQRKRLNIALELIREPSILFLDEPTSGLSSRDSENVMDLLRELTLKGKLIFVVIHQPSSELFKMFDRVVVLDEGGRMVYYGNPVEAVIHFKKADRQVNAGMGECPVCGNVNPELIFNILEARQVDEFGHYTDQRKISPAAWEEIYRKNPPKAPVTKAHTPPPASLRVPNKFFQFINYLKRDVKTKINNRQYLLLTLLVSPVLA
ncbi:MAG TPA: ATP-binding cassette domain-containing protein, partial [Bacteroides sp.]|nr:ATP-binding cassette domain-containing protein [Bacteroides sp.]